MSNETEQQQLWSDGLIGDMADKFADFWCNSQSDSIRNNCANDLYHKMIAMRDEYEQRIAALEAERGEWKAIANINGRKMLEYEAERDALTAELEAAREWEPLADGEYKDGNKSHFKIMDDGHTVKVYSRDDDGPFTIVLHFEELARICQRRPAPDAPARE